MDRKRPHHATTEGKRPHPVIPRSGPRQPYPVVPLSSRVRCDPVTLFAAMLEAGITPDLIWPAGSGGHQELLQSTPKQEAPNEPDQPAPTAWSENYPAKRIRLQEILRRRLAGDPTAPRTAIRTHRDVDCLISQAQHVICTFDWFHDPAKAVFVCADQSEASEIEALLRRDNVQGRGEDLLGSAQDLAEGLMAPSAGWRFSGRGPVVVASEISPSDGWREVFLSPRCRGLQAQELLQPVRAAQMGVHLVKAASRPCGG